MLLIALVGVFVATATLVVGVYLFVNRRQLATAETARARLAAALTFRAPQNILRDTTVSELPFLDRMLAGRSATRRLADAIERAGIDTKPGTFVLVTGIAGLCAVLVASFLDAGFALLWFAGGAAIPPLWLQRAGRRRLAAFQEQLPDALDMLVGAMRAGYSLQTAMKFIGEEMPAPLGPEFARFYDEQRLGMDVREALLALQARMGSADLHMFITAVLVQRETGGNLGEILGNIADVMRQRSDVQRQIETLTAESKLSARVLALLPGAVFVAMLALDPEFMRPMLDLPLGRMLLGVAAASVILGYVILMRIARVDL